MAGSRCHSVEASFAKGLGIRVSRIAPLVGLVVLAHLVSLSLGFGRIGRKSLPRQLVIRGKCKGSPCQVLFVAIIPIHQHACRMLQRLDCIDLIPFATFPEVLE